MPPKLFDRETLINITLYFEGFLLLVATIWAYLSHINLAQSLAFTWTAAAIGVGAGIALALTSTLFFWLGKYFMLFNQLRQLVIDYVKPMFTDITVIDALLIALASGFCEEIFFRGVMQVRLGIWWTSLVFGLIHGPLPSLFSYALWATLAGLFLGILTEWQKTLWTPILCHMVSNFIALIFLRYFVKPVEPKPEET